MTLGQRSHDGDRERLAARGSFDRSSALPYDTRSKEVMRDEIVWGNWWSGPRISLELELCHVLNVSVTIVRQALGKLERCDMSDRSPYRTLTERYGLHIWRGCRMLEAIATDASAAELFGAGAGDPLPDLRSLAYLGDGRAIEYYETRHRDDRRCLEAEPLREGGLGGNVHTSGRTLR